MRNRSANLVVAAALSVTAAACAGGGDRKNEQRGGARGTQERVTVTGCVQGGTADTYELRQLAEVPAVQQTTGQAAAAGTAGTARTPLPSGSWARLTGGKDMKEYLGQRVRIEGWIADTGESTIGTSGVTDPGARGETKDAKPPQPTVEAPRASLANGQPPAIAVEQVKAEGACSAGQ
jgi:hypothetical protein